MKPNEIIKKLNFFNKYYIELERPSEKLVEEKQKNRAGKWFSRKEINKDNNNIPFVIKEEGLIIFV